MLSWRGSTSAASSAEAQSPTAKSYAALGGALLVAGLLALAARSYAGQSADGLLLIDQAKARPTRWVGPTVQPRQGSSMAPHPGRHAPPSVHVGQSASTNPTAIPRNNLWDMTSRSVAAPQHDPGLLRGLLGLPLAAIATILLLARCYRRTQHRPPLAMMATTAEFDSQKVRSAVFALTRSAAMIRYSPNHDLILEPSPKPEPELQPQIFRSLCLCPLFFATLPPPPSATDVPRVN